MIGRFSDFIYPTEDRFLQLSALMLEIALEAKAAFYDSGRYDVIDDFMTLACGAVVGWEKMPALIRGISWMPQFELEDRATRLARSARPLARRERSRAEKIRAARRQNSRRAPLRFLGQGKGFLLVRMNIGLQGRSKRAGCKPFMATATSSTRCLKTSPSIPPSGIAWNGPEAGERRRSHAVRWLLTRRNEAKRAHALHRHPHQRDGRGRGCWKSPTKTRKSSRGCRP